jgi:hypothetical protein
VRRLIIRFLIGAALLVCLPSVALADSQSLLAKSDTDMAGVGLPIVQVPTLTTRVSNFPTDGAQALKAAEANRTMDALHAREHPLQWAVNVWNDQNWFVDFSYHGKRVAEVVETRDARVTAVWTGPQSILVYARGDFATQFGHWWLLVPFSILFLLPFLDRRRPWRMLHLDALVLLSFLISYLLFDHAKFVPGVWLAYPPLLYLLARMLWIGFRSAHRRGGLRPVPAALAPLLSLRVLGIGLVALVIARIVLSLTSGTVVDVGYASVIGAHRIAAGQPLYFVSPSHGDTYGPLAYLAYLPFELLFPWHGTWGYLPSAHAASIVFDLVTIAGLVALGRRLRPGVEGRRLGLVLGWVWSACPFTLLALMMHTNDGLIAMLSVLSLLAFASPALRGVLLGLAAAAKFAPAALIGLYAGQRDRGFKGTIVCVISFAAVVMIAIGLYLPTGGLTEFYNHTIGFQLDRSDPFSPWGLHPSLGALKTVIEGGALLLAAAVAFVPRGRRTIAQVCALAAAVTIAVQLPAEHWFYYYIVWFMPFVAVALLVRDGQPDVTDTDQSAPSPELSHVAASSPEPVATGV